MKKQLLGLVTAAAVISTSGIFAIAETEPVVWNSPTSGVEVTIPESWMNTGYYVPSGVSSISEDAILTYALMITETEDKLEEMQNTESQEAFSTYVNERLYDLFWVASVRGEQGYDDVVKYLADTYNMEDPAPDLMKLEEVGEWTFYTCEDVLRRPDSVEGTDEIVERVLADQPKIYENMRFYEPEEQPGIKDGTQLSFRTVDFDGNEADSSELFAQNEYTMVNLWMSWCHFCIEELPELEKMNQEFAENNCAIIGVMLDGDQEEELQTGKAAAEEAGVTFPMLIPTEEMHEQLAATSFPTTIFVNSEGVVVGRPIVGADLDGYRERMNALVTGEKVETEEAAETEETADAEEDSEAPAADGYRVIILDEDEAPVPDVFIQFCSDSECMMGTTDEDGTAAFDADAGTFAVHILKVPEGFEPDSEEYAAPEEPGDVVITLLHSDTEGVSGR